MVDAEKYLKQYIRIVQRIEDLKENLAELYKDIAAIKSAWPDGERHVHGTDQTAEQAMKLFLKNTDAIKDRITEKIIESWRKKIEIIIVLGQVSDGVTADVLKQHYIDMKGYEEIAENLGYSSRQVERINAKGIKEVRDILEKMS